MLARAAGAGDSGNRSVSQRSAPVISGEDSALRGFVAEKWPEMLVALGFLLTWTAIAFSDF